MPATAEWQREQSDAPIIREIGTCLRLIECAPETPRHLPAGVEDAVFDLWEAVRENIYESWMAETDPVNLQPKVRPLNHRVAEFIRTNRPLDSDAHEVNDALDILEAPWPRREETLLLRDLFNDDHPNNAEKARRLVEFILGSGLEPFAQPPLLPPIEMEDIRLVCWMAIDAAAPAQS